MQRFLNCGVVAAVLVGIGGRAVAGNLASGVHLDDLPDVDIAVDNSDFFGNLAQKATLTLFAGDTQVMQIDLEDAANAKEALIECQKAQG